MTARELRAVDGGRAPGGWEQLWALDRWPARALPHGDLHSSSNGAILFSGLVQPWLKEAVKRWVRARLLAGTSPNSLRHYVDHLQAFSGWLSERTSELNSPAQITRLVLEDYMLAVRASGLADGSKTGRVGVLRAFLEEQREDGLAGLPRSAVIHAGELPTVGRWLPRGIERGVFEQFIDPSNLALLSSEPQRTVILLLAFTGLRVSSIVTLPHDALQVGSDNHPYLRYLNVKLRREAVIPIGPALCEQLRRQERYLNETYGADGTQFLLPSRRRRDGSLIGGQDHLDVSTVRQTVKRYVRKAEIRDSRGRLASWVHPHRFRHYLGSSMVNEGVPLPVIQRVLDHASIAMTARYAHLDDETVKREIVSFQERVNIRGERIALPVGGPLEEAAWMKERISRAKQALANGYCGLPLVQSCPHPNACLSCDNFLTDSSFRHVHERQLAHTQRLRDHAQQNENVRLVDLLEADEQSLRRILDGLDAIETDAEQSAGIDVVELAARRQAKTKGSER
jgi:site-specific recombinase XerD